MCAVTEPLVQYRDDNPQTNDNNSGSETTNKIKRAISADTCDIAIYNAFVPTDLSTPRDPETADPDLWPQLIRILGYDPRDNKRQQPSVVTIDPANILINAEDTPHINVKTQGRDFTALLDSGATISCIRQGILPDSTIEKFKVPAHVNLATHGVQ